MAKSFRTSPVQLLLPWHKRPKPHGRGTVLALPDEVRIAIPLLLPSAAKSIIDSLETEAIPGTLEVKSPEQLMARFIGEHGPTAKVAKTAELESDISKMKTALHALHDGGDTATEMVVGLRATIESAEAMRAKLLKGAPSQGHAQKAVAEAKSSYELAMQARRDREFRGAAKARERSEQRHKSIQELKQHIARMEEGIIELETQDAAKHAERVKSGCRS